MGGRPFGPPKVLRSAISTDRSTMNNLVTTILMIATVAACDPGGPAMDPIPITFVTTTTGTVVPLCPSDQLESPTTLYRAGACSDPTPDAITGW